MLAQIVFIAFVLVLTAWMLRSRETAHGKAWRRILLLLFASLVIFTILFPEITSWVADALGIGRGTDLIVYLSAFTLMFMAVLMYRKFERVEMRLARVARALALAEWDEDLRNRSAT